MKKKVVNESKDDKFKRIASARANKILHYIRLLGNCANMSIYSYTEDEIDYIFSTIEKELRLAKSKFEFNKEYKKIKF